MPVERRMLGVAKEKDSLVTVDVWKEILCVLSDATVASTSQELVPQLIPA